MANSFSGTHKSKIICSAHQNFSFSFSFLPLVCFRLCFSALGLFSSLKTWSACFRTEDTTKSKFQRFQKRNFLLVRESPTHIGVAGVRSSHKFSCLCPLFNPHRSIFQTFYSIHPFLETKSCTAKVQSCIYTSEFSH